MQRFLLLVTAIILTCCSAIAEDFTSVKAKHILVDTKSQALQIKNDIEEGGSFDYYARRYSKCPSGRNGGGLGYFGRGQMVPEFEKAAFEGKIGEVSEPVKTQFGWHLIMVEDKVK